MITETIKCDRCGQLFENNSENFYTIKGNINIGLTGGVIGNNFDEDKKTLNRENHYCKFCLCELLEINMQTTR